MLQLTQTEIFSTRSAAFVGGINNAITGKLAQNIGVIQPRNIETALIDLKKYAKTKSASSPCLLSAIDLYENYGGRIQLFDLALYNSVKSDIPSFFPFIPGNAHRPDVIKAIPAIYVNMYRLGNWNADETEFENLFPITDLHTCLESGFIAYKMIIEGRANDILSNGQVIENLTRIYTKLFYEALIKIPGNLPLLDFQQEAGKFIIAKFFLSYILQKNIEDPSMLMYAKLAANSKSSITALQSYEENLGINYTKLSQFLSSFGLVFFNGHPTSLADFERAWISMYGEGLALAIEYVPYLLHFLFAIIHSSNLGNTSRLIKRFNMQSLQKEGLIKLYNGVLNGVMK